MSLQEFKEQLIAKYPFRDGMDFMAVDGNGEVWQYQDKPRAYYLIWGVSPAHNSTISVGNVDIPEGIDWRDTLISRAESDQLADTSDIEELFLHLAEEHGLILLEHEKEEIKRIIND